MNEILENEKKIMIYIRKIRKDGMNIEEIANKIGKSMGYVYSRINKSYCPLSLRDNKKVKE